MTAFAASFCARHQHLAGFIDTNETNVQAELLRANGLEVLNVKVLESASGEVLDLIAEHNTAAMLVGRGFTGLEHEPPSMSKPVDLVGVRDGRTYRIGPCTSPSRRRTSTLWFGTSSTRYASRAWTRSTRSPLTTRLSRRAGSAQRAGAIPTWAYWVTIWARCAT